jgi:hypothetical protein
VNPTTYAVPDDPADPEAAAYELIVRLPEAVLRDSGVREILQELAAMLDAEAAFDGLSWHDAKHAASAIVPALSSPDESRLAAESARVHATTKVRR